MSPATALSDRVAIVTGASRGLGEGIAFALAAAGAAVALFARDRERLDAHVAAIREAGGTAAAWTVDVADAERVRAAVSRVAETLGAPDILVNNAAIAPSVPFLDMTDAARDEVMAVNVNGPWNCARAVLPTMVERGHGRIVNISSVTGPVVSGAGVAAYSASKGALSALTRALALEFAGSGITVNAVCPGSFDTPMMRGLAAARGPTEAAYLDGVARSIPAGRLGTIEEMGALVAFLASDAAGYVNGAEIVIDGANAIQEH